MEFRKLRADEIDVRIGSISKDKNGTVKGVSLLLYKDARCDMNILDETVGVENWQRNHEVINGNLFCNVGIYIKERNEWIWKQDVGTESNTEKEKGQASDSFKRACFCLGIGRELYTSPFIWFNASDVNIDGGRCNDKFIVREIGYTGNEITKLVIENTKKKTVFKYESKGNDFKASQTEPNEVPEPVEVPTEENINDVISETEYYTLLDLIAQYDASNEKPLNQDKMKSHFNVESFMLITKAQYLAFTAQLKKGIK